MAEEWHLTVENLVGILVERDSELLMRFFAHALESCETCRASYEEFNALSDGLLAEGVGALTASAPAAPQPDARTAPWRFKELMDLPAEERLEAVRRQRERFALPEVADRLIEAARAALPAEPARSGELAELACLVLRGMPPVSENVRCFTRALAYLANSRRCAGRLDEADRLYGIAYYLSGVAGQEALVRAELHRLEASLRRDQAQLGRADGLLIEAADLYRRHGEPAEEARTLLKLSSVRMWAGDYLAAVAVCRQLLAMEEVGEQGPELHLWAWHNLADALSKMGEREEALEALRESAPLYRGDREGLAALRRVWIMARLNAQSGDTDNAVTDFAAVARGFYRRELPFDGALADLERAGLLLDAGRWPEVQELAAEMTATFERLGVHREALMAAQLFTEAAQRQQLTAAYLEQLVSFLQGSRGNPQLRFANGS